MPAGAAPVLPADMPEGVKITGLLKYYPLSHTPLAAVQFFYGSCAPPTHPPFQRKR